MIQYLTNYLKPKKEFGASEVEWAYRQFLQRSPESPEVIQGHLKVSKNLKQLTENILASQEYKDKSTGLKDSQTRERVYPLTVEERVEMTSLCQDTQNIPKVADAGKTLVIDGQRVQIMHEGTKVIAGGYNGEWMERIITRLSGHHEPQEELLFHHLLKYVREGSLIVELGAFWAYYTNWYLGAVKGSSAVCIEPDANSMACGLANLTLNGRKANFINACVGEAFCEETRMQRESDGATVSMPCHNMDTLMDILGNRTIEMLHMDVQGAEFPFLKSIEQIAKKV
jgi:FkbM family methyltransferase